MDNATELVGAGAREIAMGKAAGSDTSAFVAVFWNPAMLAFKNDLAVSLNGKIDDPLGSADKFGAFGIDWGFGGRLSVGFAALYRENEKENTEDDILGYAGLGYRLNRLNGIGVSLSILSNKYQSPLSFDLGWYRYWNAKWQSSLQVRNLGFNSRLSAAWQRNSSGDISQSAELYLRPKTFELGITHRNFLLRKPASVSLALVSYQTADTLFVFDPDWHIFKGHAGFEWAVWHELNLRCGLDGKEISAGAGYNFSVGEKTLSVDFAYPFSLGLRARF
ncbi:hypothetical protein AGMMS49938_09120 [Fibrobacterales bacterium]|nr:hypothetical protein AGMMS49938_09120 [Fibrobacterales bacterium]